MADVCVTKILKQVLDQHGAFGDGAVWSLVSHDSRPEGKGDDQMYLPTSMVAPSLESSQIFWAGLVSDIVYSLYVVCRGQKLSGLLDEKRRRTGCRLKERVFAGLRGVIVATGGEVRKTHDVNG